MGGYPPESFPMTSTRQTGWTADVIPTLYKKTQTLRVITCTFTMLGAANAIRPTQATRTAQGVPRRSRRLQGQPPEFQRTAFKCHFCLRDEESCNRNVVYLSCCRHYVHRSCQAEWVKTSQTCAMCRQPCALGAPTPPVITNAQILNRLRHLLESGELQRELEQVGYYCIAFNNVYGTYRYEMDIYGFEIE